MAVEQYVTTRRFNPTDVRRISLCNAIVADYKNQGLALTLRQLYYQLVTKNEIPNEERSYKKLGKLISDARLAGQMDWEAIEDRVRQPVIPPEWDNLRDIVDAALRGYRLPRWAGQKDYVELWVEKDALAGVLKPLADKWHVTLMVNRGYSSQSAMYESAQRFRDKAGLDMIDRQLNDFIEVDEQEEDGSEKLAEDVSAYGLEQIERAVRNDDQDVRRPTLLYLGDLDPSGEDMVRDIRDRLTLFKVWGLTVTKLALNPEQVKRYKPPPNPAKFTDSRAGVDLEGNITNPNGYVAKHGRKSWEVDALPPKVLQQIIESAFKAIVDRPKMDAIKTREESDKDRLREAVEDIEDT